MMIKWLHHLFNPHCDECRDEREEARQCKSCEVLSMQLERSQAHVQQLLNSITQPKITQEPPSISLENLEPIRPSRYVPFSVRRQSLEAESKKQAELLKNKIEEIESETGLGEEKENAGQG